MAIDGRNQYALVVLGKLTHPFPLPANFQLFSFPVSERVMNIIWYRLGLPFLANWVIPAADIFHSPNFMLPPLRRTKTLITIHDLSFVRFPECADPALAKFLTRMVPRWVRRADMVLADSESTKSDLIEWIAIPQEKIEVVYGGVEDFFVPVRGEGVLASIQQKYLVPKPYILTMGTLEPRKNIGRLIEAYAILKQETGLLHTLIVAGGKGWLYSELFTQVDRLGLHQDVVFLGYVPDTDLPPLISGADLFVFPSLYEGFGLPPLEAMACGCPVVSSQAASLMEILGDAALYFEAIDVRALAQAIERALADRALRETLIERGLAQAARFTWKAAAEKLLRVYEQVGKG